MRSGMPFWFRATIAGGFGTLFALFILARDPARGGVFASTLLDEAARVAPMLGPPPSLQALEADPSHGAYLVNGMRVEYAVLPITEKVGTVMGKLAVGFEQAGYEHRTSFVNGFPAVTAIHPKSKMLLTARIEEGPEGETRLRLSQQNLTQWKADFHPRIAELPDYPGATSNILVDHLGKRRVRTLTYSVGSTPQAAARIYADVLRNAGWVEDQPPLQMDALPIHFFRGPAGECSILATVRPDGMGSLVMVTLDSGGVEKTA